MTINFPALADVEAKLARVFDQAGPDLDLMKAEDLSGGFDQRVAQLKELNSESEHLRKTLGAATGQSASSREAGGDFGSGGRWQPDGLSVRPLRKGESLLERCTKAAGRNPWPDDEEWRLSLLGAAFTNNSRKVADLSRHIKVGSGAELKAMDTAGASAIMPAPVAAFVIDKLRAAAVTQRLGAQTVPMTSSTLKVPRLTGDPTVSWLAEGATVTATDASLDSVTLTARRLSGLTLVSQELAEDSDPAAVGTVLAESFGRALGTELDRVTLKGSGTAPEPRGIRNQSGVSVNATAAASTWAVLTERVGVLLAANVPMERIGVAVNVASWSTLFAQVAAGGDWIAPPYGMSPDRILSTSTLAGPATGELYAGDFTEVLIGVRVALDFQILRERYADSGQIGVLPRVRADVQVKHGAAFALRTALSS